MKIAKIINDPIYGFINLPHGIILDLIDHPYFQRLRRIKQLGMSHLVYPGAMHVRFHHAIGAYHLMTQAISVLKQKGVEISKDEKEAVSIAILLHDIGHGPFSHALEYQITDRSHETISLLYMEQLNEEFNGKLSLAIKIFKNEYHKPFLYQLISSQLDMDRMDYLNRDSFYSGVSEGVIGYHRIIKMLSVVDGQLTVEEKGIYSIESFLMARRIMYWQVYLHKTVVVAEKMLALYFQKLKMLVLENRVDFLPEYLERIIRGGPKLDFLKDYTQLDDTDIIFCLKKSMSHSDKSISYLANAIINRKLYKIRLQKEPFTEDYIENVKIKINLLSKKENVNFNEMVLIGQESTQEYLINSNEISILSKNGEVKPFSFYAKQESNYAVDEKYYIIFPLF